MIASHHLDGAVGGPHTITAIPDVIGAQCGTHHSQHALSGHELMVMRRPHGPETSHTRPRPFTATGSRMVHHAGNARSHKTIRSVNKQQPKGSRAKRYRHETNQTEGEEAHSHHEPELLQRCCCVRVARCCRCHRPCWLTRASRPRRHVGCRPREAIRRATSSSCDRRRHAACELAGHVAGLRDGPISSSSATTCAAARAPSWEAATARAAQAHGRAPFRG